MSYESFKAKVQTLLNRIGQSSVEFFNDDEKGQYFAKCSEEVMIIGHSGSLKVTVRWGSGHTAMATI